MQTVGKILVYVLAVAVLGCLLAPPLYWLGQWALDQGMLSIIKGIKFPRYFNRAMLIVTLASIYPFLRWLGLRSMRDLGLSPNPRRFSDLAVGIAIGIVGLWLVAALLVGTEHVTLKMRWHKLPPILLTAALVPLIEETFFQGALFGMLRRTLPWKWALLFLSLLFAAVHFIKPPSRMPKIKEVNWLSGFELLPKLFWQFGKPELLVGGLLTLFLVGWTLGYTVVKTRSLYLAMGLHGGWVFALRSFDQLSKRRVPSSIWIGKDLTVGLLPVAMLLVTLLFLYFLLQTRQSEPSS